MASVTGDVSHVTQTLHAGGVAAAELGVVLDKLLARIAAAPELGALQKVEAWQEVEKVAAAAVAPADPAAKGMAAKAFERLMAILGKVPDATKLVEAGTKAWEAVSGSL